MKTVLTFAICLKLAGQATRAEAYGNDGIVRLNSILPAGALGWGGARLFLLTNRQRVRRDSTPKMAYTAYTNLP